MKEPFLKYITDELEPGFLMIACGLPGTWKTETTTEVARIKGYPQLRTDIIRLEVLKGEDVFDRDKLPSLKAMSKYCRFQGSTVHWTRDGAILTMTSLPKN